MILLLNGPFGVGKTTTARLLVQRIPDAMLYDPEIIGFVLRRIPRPFGTAGDYQDHTLWRRLLVAVAGAIRTLSARTLVIPMTMWRRDYFVPIVAGLRRVDPDLACFRLTASKDVLLHRISSDLQDTGAFGWRISHADLCTRALRNPALGAEVRTDGLSPSEVANEVLRAIRGRQTYRFPTPDSRLPEE